MCLTTKQICPIRARKDIVVYKVLIKSRKFVNRNVYYTPVMGKYIELHKTFYATTTNKNNDKRKAYYPSKGRYDITSGFIHCYTNRTDIPHISGIRLFGRLYIILHRAETAVMVKCIIRKGTLYYKSYDGIEICATQVDVLDEVA